MKNPCAVGPAGSGRRLFPRVEMTAVHFAVILTIILPPALAEVPVGQTWNQEYGELLRQIDGLKNSDRSRRERLLAEALDPQTLILPEDRDPLSVVLRRTRALVQYFKQRELLSSAILSDFETRLHRLSDKAHSTSPSETQRTLFNQACELRRQIGVGGSRTTPGNFGAHASGLMQVLTKTSQHKDLELTPDDWRRITLWLDLNSNEIGWIGNDRIQIAAQKNGVPLWPPVDVDASHPTGVKKNRPLPGED